MYRVATVLIVMALAGSPAAKLACDLWCQAESHLSGAADAACHGGHHGSGQAIQATPDICSSVAAPGPFVTQTTYRVPQSVAGPSVVADVSAWLLDLRHDDGAFLLRGDPGPPPGHIVTVLRT